MATYTGNLIYNKYTLTKNKNKRIECNSKFCYYYEELLKHQTYLTDDEHISCFTYLWWISTDTDLLSDDECVHQSHAEKLKSDRFRHNIQ